MYIKMSLRLCKQIQSVVKFRSFVQRTQLFMLL